MNSKKTVVILAVLLVAVIGGAALLYPRLAAGTDLPGLPGNAPADPGGSASQTNTVPAPSVPLETPEGGTVQLSDFFGEKPVVLNFWASTCPPCKEEMPDFQAAFEEYGDEIQFVMVNVGDAMRGETRDKAEAFLADGGYTFPVYYDLNYQATSAYGVTGFPHTYFIDGSGSVVVYAPGMISAEILQDCLNRIAPEIVPAP